MSLPDKEAFKKLMEEYNYSEEEKINLMNIYLLAKNDEEMLKIQENTLETLANHKSNIIHFNTDINRLYVIIYIMALIQIIQFIIFAQSL